MIRRPPRSKPIKSSAASDVYKRQLGLRVAAVVTHKIEVMPSYSIREIGLQRHVESRKPMRAFA